MKRIHQYIKELELKFRDDEPDEQDRSIFSFSEGDDDDDDNDDQDGEGDHSFDDSDLFDLENRIKKDKEDTNQDREEGKSPPYNPSEPKQRSKATYQSPEKEENNLNNYLTNCNLVKSQTEDNSFSISQERTKSRDSFLNSQWSGLKHHASTSRINTCPRFERDRPSNPSSKASSHLRAQGTAIVPQNRRSINRSMYFPGNTTRNYDYSQEQKTTSLRYKLAYPSKYGRKTGSRESKLNRNVYRSCEGYDSGKPRNMY